MVATMFISWVASLVEWRTQSKFDACRLFNIDPRYDPSFVCYRTLTAQFNWPYSQTPKSLRRIPRYARRVENVNSYFGLRNAY
jgi:hypothetical protein